MDGPTFVETLRADNETALSRLGSSKSLYALTGGEMDAPSVRAAARDEAESAYVIFEEWAETESRDEAAALFAAVAETEERHRDEIESEGGDPDTDRPMYETLAGFDDAVERVAGLLARSVVAKETAAQMVGFFVGSAKTSSADTFRGIRGDFDDQTGEAARALDEICERDEDWERAESAANAVVQAAYDDYVETLESMGVKPKNVC
ncbi:transcription antitermination protein [Halegenticoccus tardaugens]|uniref:transcription antitermination protein n=1 Tax=Halegenticoccus tardaugens TaxID=2071624 RepID=UPI00100B473C|nr:transcription antitermination protein [Halegenticoccus tardaugens]